MQTSIARYVVPFRGSISGKTALLLLMTASSAHALQARQPAAAGIFVNVPANANWVLAVGVKAGQTLKIEATGKWSNVGPPSLGPEGFAGYRHPGTILGSADLGSLIGKLDGTAFSIGHAAQVVAKSDGELFLSINDTPGTFADNQGAMSVRVVVTAAGPQLKNEWSKFDSHQSLSATPAAVEQVTYKNSSDAIISQTLMAYAQDSYLYLRDADTGDLVAQPYNTGGGAANKPAIAKLSDGRWYVFATSSNGFVYKLDVALSRENPGQPLQVANNGRGQINYAMQRSTCVGGLNPDRLTLAPILQLAAASNGGYTLGKDVVIIATHHGCGSITTNRVYALDAADITLPALWAFNEDPSYQIDYWTSCILDYDRNSLFCGANLESGRFQHTVWSINTSTGKRNWSIAGPGVQANLSLGRPAAGAADHLYVAGANDVRALDPATGTEKWSLTVAPGVGILFTGLSVGEGAYGKTIVVTTSDNVIRAIRDRGPAADYDYEDVIWSRSFGTYASEPRLRSTAELVSSIGKLYIGLSDGSVRQFSLKDGTSVPDEYSIVPNWGLCPSSTWTQPTVYTHGSATKLLALAQCGGVKRFSLPFQALPQY